MRLGIRKLSFTGLMVLLGLVALLAAGCGTNSGNGGQAASQVLHVSWASGGGSPDITTLDPGLAQDSSAIPIVDLVYDGLVVLDHNGKVTPWGASKWDVSNGGLTYTFHLRPNQKFSDGTPVTASDYAYAIDRTLNPCLQSGVNYYLWTIKDAQTFSNETCDTKSGKITAGQGQTTPVLTTLVGDSIKAVDPNTLQIQLQTTAGYFLDALSYSSSYALEKSTVTGPNLGADDKWIDNLTKGSTGQGGSGMFYVSKWNHQGDLVLKANPNWWGVSAGMKPKLSEIDYKIFASADTGYSTYISNNNYDLLDDGMIPPDQLAQAKTRPDFHTGPFLAIQSLEMNWKIAPFDDLNARKAFCLAINRDTIVNNVLKGADIASWHLVPQGMPGYNANLKSLDGAPTAGDQAKALQYWNAYKSAHGGKVPTIQYSFNTSDSASTAFANALIAQWNQTLPGANVQTNPKPWKQTLKDEQAKIVQFYRFGWIADYPDAEDWLTLLHSTTSSYNENNASVPAADKLMQQADQSTDQTQRLSLYNQAEQMLLDNVAECPVYQYQLHYLLRTYVKNLTYDAQAQVATTDWPNIYIASH